VSFEGLMAGMREVCTKILYGNATERDNCKNLLIDGKNYLTL
jgi:hypothetical protein